MGQIHVFPLGSWMTIQVLGFKSYQFLKVVSGGRAAGKSSSIFNI